jgi:uncharacterized protein YabN with tetrapyrrole methylase and pyrophosphatase domain
MTTWKSTVTDLLARLPSEFPHADVYAVGTGISGPEHLTLEALQALAVSKKVFGFSDVTPLISIIECLGSKFEELEYPPLRTRRTVFTQAAVKIATMALQSSPVCWLTCGSPIRHVWLTHLLRKWANRERLIFRSVLAPSSLDVIMDYLQIDDSEGIQLYDSTALILHALQPDPKAHCVIFNIEKTGTELSPNGSYPRKEMLLPLKSYLLQFYPADHAVTFILVSGYTFDSRKLTLPLSKLEDAVSLKTLGTLWLPRIALQPLDNSRCQTMETLSGLTRLAHTPADRILGKAASKLAEQLKTA